MTIVPVVIIIVVAALLVMISRGSRVDRSE
jgi:hypothetical protein